LRVIPQHHQRLHDNRGVEFHAKQPQWSESCTSSYPVLNCTSARISEIVCQLYSSERGGYLHTEQPVNLENRGCMLQLKRCG
jgi:hypothetical protein